MVITQGDCSECRVKELGLSKMFSIVKYNQQFSHFLLHWASYNLVYNPDVFHLYTDND